MAVQGTVNKNYISSISFLDKRDILNQVLDIYDEGRNILDIMEMTGKMKRTSVPQYSHFENKYVFKSGVVKANGVDATKIGTVGLNLLITVAGSSATIPVVGEVVMLENGELGWCVASTPLAGDGNSTFEIQPLNPAVALNTGGLISSMDGESLIYFTNASYEGSGSPEGRKPEFTRTENQVQIFKASAKVTELQKVSAIEVDYNGKPHIMYKLQHDTLLRFRSQIAFGLLAGKKATISNSDGDQALFTQGLLNYIRGGDGTVNTTGGIVEPLGGSAIVKADFKTVSRALDKTGAPSEYWLWCGGDIDADIDDIFHNDQYYKSGGIDYTSFGIGNGKNRAMDLGMDSFRAYNRTWHKHKLLAFDHPEVFGATGYDFSGTAFALPTGKIKADASGNMIDRVCVRYMAGDGTDLRYVETLTGKFAPRPTNDDAYLKVSYEAVMGLEVGGVNQFAIFEKN